MRAWANRGNSQRMRGSNSREEWSIDSRSPEAEKITTIQTNGGNQNFSAERRIRMPETKRICRLLQTESTTKAYKFTRWEDGGCREDS